MAEPTFYRLDAAVTSRGAEVPDASFADGVNWVGSNAPGVGINMNEGAVIGEPQQFTLLDQDGDPRTPQVSQLLGGAGFVDRSSVEWPSSGGVEGGGTSPVRFGTASVSGNGGVSVIGASALPDLDGWVVNP
jgi:hypothetical protein